MNLLLHPLNDVNDPTWSVIILLLCVLAFTAYCVIYILLLSFKELEEDGQVREQGQEGVSWICEQQEAELGKRNSEES